MGVAHRSRDGAYQDMVRGKYGEEIPLPAPFSLDLTTDDLPVYGATGRH
ncbi:hypothetical protein ACIOHE_28420 [Streptomyces sp. NPDC087851]